MSRWSLLATVALVRRIARLERGGILLLVLAALPCCHVGEEAPAEGAIDLTSSAPKPPYRRVTYYLDPRPECAPTAFGQWHAVGDAFAAWQAFGVEVIESESPVGPAPNVVAVCLRDGEYWSWRYGSTVWGTDGMHMDVRIDIDQPERFVVVWSIAAHELMHVVLASNAHSPEHGLVGVRVCPTCDGFSAADIEWIESFGLEWQAPEGEPR